MSLLDDVISGKQLGQGWAGLEDMDTGKQYAGLLKRYEDAYQLVAPFRTAEGHTALHVLKALTVECPTWDGENQDYQKAIAYGFVREGQNSIYRHIMACMKIVEDGPPTPPKQGGNANG